MRAALLLIAIGVASCGTSCGTTAADGQLVTEIPKAVSSVALDCAEQATHKAALGILDDVGSALADKNWIGLLAKLGERWGSEALDCAVREVTGESHHAAMATKDETESLKASRGRTWLEARGHL